MKTYTVSQARRRLGAVLSEIASGSGVEITSRGRRVFVMDPGSVFVTVRQGDPAKLRAAAVRLKRTMPRAAKPGEKTATELLAEIRDGR